MARKNAIQEGLNAARDVGIIAATQKVTAEVVEAGMAAFDAPSLLQEFGIRSAAPLFSGATITGVWKKNDYARPAGIGMMAEGIVNGVDIGIRWAKTFGEAAEETVEGARQIAQARNRQLPMPTRERMSEESEQSAILQGGGGRQQQYVTV